MSLVSFAEEQARREDYDRIYCVFDRDTHATYDAALRRIGELPKFYAIPSWPCFEVWPLLHYRYSTAPIVRTGPRSAGDNAIRELRQHIQDYAKGMRNIFEILVPNLEEAIRHGHQLSEHNRRTGSTNPATNVQELVEFLIHLKD